MKTLRGVVLFSFFLTGLTGCGGQRPLGLHFSQAEKKKLEKADSNFEKRKKQYHNWRNEVKKTSAPSHINWGKI
jgi:hypothetical protein